MLANQIEGKAINVKSMVIHASAFGLYAIGVAVFTVFFAIYLSKDGDDKFQT